MKIYKYIYKKTDGREWIQFSKNPFKVSFKVIDEGLTRPKDWKPPSLRYNKMRAEWVAISPSRNARPFLPPKEYCPLCPVTEFAADQDGNLIKTDVPITNHIYEWAVFENIFPGVSSAQKTGFAEVILYSPNHSDTLAGSSIEHIQGLIEVWRDRSKAVGAMPGIEQVFIFENKGAEVGVTLHHPHGQLYAFNHVPPFILAELKASEEYYLKQKECLLCDEVREEIASKERLVYENSSMFAWVPKAARYPYEVHITSKQHRPLIEQLSEQEVADLAEILKAILMKFNQLLQIELPYIMVHHQAPHTQPDCRFYHWHIEFYPPYRMKGKLKYLAGVESGTGLFINDTIPEEKASELRNLSWK
jgi:UDPglucose--hexose-1-phosphate uridylyltransferase